MACRIMEITKQAKINFEMAVNNSPTPLSSIEKRVLSARFGLFGYSLRLKKECSPFLDQCPSSEQEILQNALRKCLHEPIEALMRDSDLRIERFERYGFPEGRSDLELASELLLKADALNDCRIAYGI